MIFMPKRSVLHDVEEFCGYHILLKILSATSDEMLQALIGLLFETGGRISEVLQLTPRHFDTTDPDAVIIKRMPVIKRHRRKKRPDGSTYTVSEDFTRTIPIMRTSPLLSFIGRYVRTKKLDEHLFTISRGVAYHKINNLGKLLDPPLHLYNHWFRAQKACQLAQDHEYGVFELMDFFKWKDPKMATHYASLGYKGHVRRLKKTT